MLVSIIVPCRNERGAIESFLLNLNRLRSSAVSFEAIIADGNSADGTLDVLSRFCLQHSWLKVLRNDEGSVSAGLNLALRAARGDVIVRMDVHTEYADDYLDMCVAVLETVNAENVGGAARTRPRGWLGRAIAAAYASGFACGGARFHNPCFEGYVDTVPYGCWRRETLDRLGGFDENLIRNQDDELNLRILRAGGKIYQSASIRSWYQPRTSLKLLFKQYLQYGFWKVRVIEKHGSPASLRHLAPGLFISAILSFLALLTAGALIGSSVVARFAIICLAVIAGTYAIASVSASVTVAYRGGWRLLPLLPIVFAAYHFSYGLGFLAGVVESQARRLGAKGFSERFAELSR